MAPDESSSWALCIGAPHIASTTCWQSYKVWIGSLAAGLIYPRFRELERCTCNACSGANERHYTTCRIMRETDAI